MKQAVGFKCMYKQDKQLILEMNAGTTFFIDQWFRDARQEGYEITGMSSYGHPVVKLTFSKG